MVLQRAWLELQLFPTILVCVCSDTIYSFEATTHIKDDWPLDEYCRGCNECLFFGVFYTSQLMIIDLCLWCLRGTYCNPRFFLLSPTYKSWLLRVFQTNSPTDVTVVVDGYGTWGSCRSKVDPRIGGATGTCGNLRKSVSGMEVVMAGKIYSHDGNNNQVSSIFTTTIPRLQESCFFNMGIVWVTFNFKCIFQRSQSAFFWGHATLNMVWRLPLHAQSCCDAAIVQDDGLPKRDKEAEERARRALEEDGWSGRAMEFNIPQGGEHRSSEWSTV